jgi:hypothetical protein
LIGLLLPAVERVTADQALAFFEPLNVTNEFGLTLGLHFK